MTDHLVEARQRLIDQSFVSGKADMAAGILHNIGNAVTPIAVRLNTVSDRRTPLRRRRSGARRARKRIGSAERADLARFLQLTAVELSVSARSRRARARYGRPGRARAADPHAAGALQPRRGAGGGRGARAARATRRGRPQPPAAVGRGGGAGCQRRECASRARRCGSRSSRSSGTSSSTPPSRSRVTTFPEGASGSARASSPVPPRAFCTSPSRTTARASALPARPHVRPRLLHQAPGHRSRAPLERQRGGCAGASCTPRAPVPGRATLHLLLPIAESGAAA